MTKVFAVLIICLVVCLATTMIAAETATLNNSQDSRDQSQEKINSPQIEGKTIRGCLSGSRDTLTLTEDQTGKVYSLAGNTQSLEQKGGHEIEISGQPTTGSSAAAASVSTMHADNSHSLAGTPVNTYMVSKARVISDRCGTGSATDSK